MLRLNIRFTVIKIVKQIISPNDSITRASKKTRRIGDYGPLEPPSQTKYGHDFVRIEGTNNFAV